MSSAKESSQMKSKMLTAEGEERDEDSPECMYSQWKSVKVTVWDITTLSGQHGAYWPCLFNFMKVHTHV